MTPSSAIGGEPAAAAGPTGWDRTLTVGERLRRAELPFELWAGLGVLAGFLVLAVGELAARGAAVGVLASDPAWAAGPVLGPSARHPFGVMSGLGVDVAASLAAATPWDLAIVGGILLLASGVGIVVGALAGLYEGGAVDLAVTFWTDAISGIPPVVWVAAVFFTLAPHVQSSRFLPGFVLLFGAVLWPYYARPVRARARVVGGTAYLQSARASGAGTYRLLVDHVVPNSMGPAFAQLPIDVGNVFFVLSVFPFVACYGGATPLFPLLSPLPYVPFPEWGYLLAEGACNGTSVIWTYNYWWMYTFPALAIIVFGLGIAMASDGMQKLLARPGRT